jgi:hypothetical protein
MFTSFFYPTRLYFPRWLNIGSISQTGSNKKTLWLTIVSVSKGILHVVDKSLKTSNSLCYC